MNERIRELERQATDYYSNGQERIFDRQQRLDILEDEFYLPDVIELNDQQAVLTSGSTGQDQTFGKLKVRQFRKIELVTSSEKILAGNILNGVIITMFVLSCFLMYNAIVWTIWG